MKKVLFLLPAVLSAVLYIAIGIFDSFNLMSPLAWIMILVLFISGFFMIKNKPYACIGGIFFGCYLIFMSTQYTGQIIDIERPMGIIFIVYYLICGLVIFKDNQRKEY